MRLGAWHRLAPALSLALGVVAGTAEDLGVVLGRLSTLADGEDVVDLEALL
jgi:hypothetical protein